MSDVEVNTVDGFQGREKDIIIFSTVRSEYDKIEGEKAKTIGFLRDERRMNVSLSRARLCMIIIGDLKRLMFSPNNGEWKKLIKYILKKKRCFNFDQSIEGYFDVFNKDSKKYKTDPYANNDKDKEQEQDNLITEKIQTIEN